MISESVDKLLNLRAYNYHGCLPKFWKYRYDVDGSQRFVMRKRDEKKLKRSLKEAEYPSKRFGLVY